MFDALLLGLSSALQPIVLLAMVTGLVGGVLAGAIPGLSATMAVALLLLITDSVTRSALDHMLLTTPMRVCAASQQGKTFFALKLSVVSSAIGGLVSAIALMTVAPPLAQAALAFGPPEIFWVSIFGLVSTAVLIGKDPLKGLIAACIGLLLGTVGIDTVTGVERLTFGFLELSSGLPLAVVLIALFGLPAALQIAERSREQSRSATEALSGAATDTRLRDWPWRRLVPAWVRGSVYGVFVGILPGLGGAVSSVMAYGAERRASRVPDSFGKGAPEGVAVAETANNADNAASMIPALTLAIPGSGVAAVVLAGLLIHGLEPGTALFLDNPEIVFGYMWAFLFTSILLIAVGGTLAVRLFSRVLEVPAAILAPAVLILTAVGAYTYQNSLFHVYILAALGLVGYALDRLGFPAPPIILALFLGPKVEFNMRISLRISQDDWSILYTRPISAVIAAATLAIVIFGIVRAFRGSRTPNPERT